MFVSRSSSLARLARKAVGGVAVRAYTAPIKDMRFLINEVYDFPAHYAANCNSTGGPDATPDMVEAVL